MNLCIVIPVYRHFSQLFDLLGDLESVDAQVLVVEASSALGKGESDRSDSLNLREQCRQKTLLRGGQWLSSRPSRGAQVALGCEHSSGSWLWILHADTRVDQRVTEYLERVIAAESIGWGRFDIQFLEHHQRLECLAFFMNWRSRLTRICTGDQGMFFHRDCLAHIGGFPIQPLMEDIEISSLLKPQGTFSFFAPKISLQTSGRRWLQNGWLRTILNMWRFRIQYFLGKSPQVLFDQYYRK